MNSLTRTAKAACAIFMLSVGAAPGADSLQVPVAKWVLVANASLGAEGRGASPALSAEATTLSLTSGEWMNEEGSKADYAASNMYALGTLATPVTLEEGDRLILSATIDAPAGQLVNVARSPGGVQLIFIGTGKEALPTEDTLYGDPKDKESGAFGKDLDLGGVSAINLGATLSPGGSSMVPRIGNPATATAFSSQLFTRGGNLFTPRGEKPPANPKTSTSWPGGPVQLVIERLPDNANGQSHFLVIVRIEGPGGAWEEFQAETLGADEQTNLGPNPEFTHVAIGTGGAAQLPANKTGFLQLIAADISVQLDLNRD